jgi:hypothetical protein
MEFCIADTFTQALTRLDGQAQKAVKTTAFDLQLNPSAPGLRFHRIDKSRDPNFWSVRANSDVRIIVHKTQASFLLAYVDHHDAAYAWAERRRIEAHPRTGALQIVEVRERVEEVATPAPAAVPVSAPMPDAPVPAPLVFAALSADDLLGVGVPQDWLADVQAATEDSFLVLADHLPAEAAEALLDFAVSGRLRPAPVPVVEPGVPADPVTHPDAQRRFRVVENQEELARALDAPWERWIVFLHPTQQSVVDRSFNGPARVAGSAGTGKTVVALHRAARLARTSQDARVLLTTFSQPLASALERRLKVLVAGSAGVVPRMTVSPFRAVADELYQLAFGRRATPASDEQVRDAVRKAAEATGDTGYPLRFLLSEWRHVVDAWQIDSIEAYARVPRLGRKSRMSAGQRERLWPVFEAVRASLKKRGLLTWSDIFGLTTDHFLGRAAKPFKHIVVDEAQDLGVPELRFLAAIAPTGPDALFFAGDLGQRIFQQPFSWKELGVDVRGRSFTLTVNYRTSHQIRRMADRLLPPAVRDVDGLGDDRDRTVSIFNGPDPELVRYASRQDETAGVSTWLRAIMAAGVAPSEIGVFVRSRDQMDRARAVVAASGVEALELSERDEAPGQRMPVGTMHLAKGLEFKAVVVMACDDDVLPLRSRVESVADEVELDDVYETERHLFYVACTRARDRLLVSGVLPASEFLADIEDMAHSIGTAAAGTP